MLNERREMSTVRMRWKGANALLLVCLGDEAWYFLKPLTVLNCNAQCNGGWLFVLAAGASLGSLSGQGAPTPLARFAETVMRLR